MTHGTGPVDSANIFLKLIEWVWLPILLILMRLWQTVTSVKTEQALLRLSGDVHEKQRTEDRELRESQRREILARIDTHNDAVMKRIDQVEKLIRNGHN